MYFYLTILLLLNWSCVKGIEENNQNVIPDQIALPSKREIEKLPNAGNIYENLSSNKTAPERVTSHYENSNGFKPIVVLDHRRKNEMTKPKETQQKSESVLENDPVYSMEARMFLNLPQSGTNRRQFDSGDRRSDLEILKVDRHTPEVANYQEFYENVKSVMNNNQDPADIGKKKVSRTRGRDRIKKVQNADIYDSNYYRDDRDSYNRHFPVNSYNSNQFKSNYDTEKVNNNHHEQDMSGYNFQRYVASKEKLVPRTNSNTRQLSEVEKKTKSEGVHKSNLEYSGNQWKNLEATEPGNYSSNWKLGSQNFVASPLVASTVSSLDISPSYTQSPLNIYVQDSSYDNSGTSRHYERSENSQGISDEVLDYVEVTEKPRRIHKSRRRPQTSELSRKLPKEHRAVAQDTDDRKRLNLTRAKQRHRHRNKPNHWDDEESNEEKLIDNSENDDDQNSNSWNQVGNVEVSHSNGYQVEQIEKPKLLLPLNVNLVPLSQFNHQNALGTSQGFDINNAMIQNLGGGMSIISTAAPYASSSPNFLSTPNLIKNDQTFKQVPDVIVGQSSMQSPVSVILPQGQTARSTSSTTPRIFASTITPTYQQIPLNHLPANQILLPQSNLLSNMLQTNNIQIQPHGIQGQNLVPLQNIPVVSTTASPISQKQDGHFLATASLAVGNDGRKSNQKTIIQTQMVPVLHSLGTINLNNQNQAQNSFLVGNPKENAQIQKATNDAFMSSMKDLQLQIQRNQVTNPEFQDSTGSSSNSINTVAGIPFNIIRAQLPVLGTKNVEIVNPNFRPNSVDWTVINPVTPVNQFAAMYTTPVPVISTAGFMTPRPIPSASESINLANYVDSLTEYGTKSPPRNSFNNYLPSDDIMKSSNRNNKSKLKSEIAKYAEEMVRESLKSVYNSQKWNTDNRNPGNVSLVDSSELAKLRNELLRLKPINSDSKSPKDVLEAHQTESKIRTSNSRPKSNSQKPPFSMEQIAQILKDDMKLYSDYFGKSENDEGKNFRINDYLTPPRPNSFLPKSPYHEKPVKKRPGPRPQGFNRSRPRKPGGYNSKPHGLETAASSNFEYGFDHPRFRNRPHFEPDFHEYRPGRHGHSKYRQKNRIFESQPSFPSSLDNEQRALSKDIQEVNNPKFHNLLGLLMKNKRLPNGIPQNYVHQKDMDNFVKLLEVEKQRLEHQMYNDALHGLQNKLDVTKLAQQNSSQNNPKF